VDMGYPTFSIISMFYFVHVFLLDHYNTTHGDRSSFLYLKINCIHSLTDHILP